MDVKQSLADYCLEFAREQSHSSMMREHGEAGATAVPSHLPANESLAFYVLTQTESHLVDIAMRPNSRFRSTR